MYLDRFESVVPLAIIKRIILPAGGFGVESKAKNSFEIALADVDNLIEFHLNAGGDAPGRRPANFQSLNKSAIVLTCAAWESYIEYLIIEIAERNIGEAEAPKDMLKTIQGLVSGYIQSEKDKSAWTTVAGDGWKAVANRVVCNRVLSLNTPKTANISRMMKDIIDICDIEGSWSWAKNKLGDPARRLDAFVTLRGAIAHGVQKESVNKNQVEGGIDLVTRLVEKVEERVFNENLLKI